MATEVVVTADKIKNKKKFYKIISWTLLAILFLMICLYIVLGVIYNGGSFTISLDQNFVLEQGLVLYDDLKYKEQQVKLSAGKIDFMDNISIDWLPKNIDTESDGIHNGDNYIAYTYYIENIGTDTVNYWSELYIDDVIKNVDEAVRVIMIQNGLERTVYAKANSITSLPEKDTEQFYSENKIFLRQRNNFNSGDIDKYTIVIFLEGNDPDCIDDLLGGEIKMHMKIRSEHFVEE